MARAAADYPNDPNAPALQTTSSRTLRGLEGRKAALGVAISTDGKITAAGTWIGELKLINNGDGSKLPAPEKHRVTTDDVAFSPDGKELTSAGRDDAVRV